MSAPEFGDPRLPERFWAKVRVNDETGCWEWGGTRNVGGYGRLMFDGRLQLAHRVAYASLAGVLPEWTPGGLQIDHLCRVRACCNPDHLELVTPQENCLRGDAPAAKNAVRTHCPRGHALAGDNLAQWELRRGWRRCATCQDASNAERASLISAAHGALGITFLDYGATFSGSKRVAERIVAAIESGIAPEVIVANARAAHEAIRAENVDAWLATLRPAGQLALEATA